MSPAGPLLIFDFDHTITDKNTDVEVRVLKVTDVLPEIQDCLSIARFRSWRLEETFPRARNCEASTPARDGPSSWGQYLTCCIRTT